MLRAVGERFARIAPALAGAGAPSGGMVDIV